MPYAQNNANSRSGNEGALLRALIAKGTMGAAFQPIVDLSRGEIIAYEALSRPPEGCGFANAGVMFEAAEHEGLLWELEELTRRATVQGVGSWPPNIKLFLNSSPSVLADPRFAETVRTTLERGDRALTGPSRGIVLEITEQSTEQHVRGLAEQARALREAGFEIAIDDVGAGTSGMNRIMLLRPQWLKLDREFVQGIDTDGYRRNLVRFFVHFARLSGVNVIAEGIERREELAELIQLGVRYGQGYYLGRPSELAAELDDRLADWIRERWWAAWSQAGLLGRLGGMSGLARRVWTCDTASPIGLVSRDLAKDDALAGVVVLDGRRYAGWCSREAVLRAAAQPGQGINRPISEIHLAAGLVASPDDTVGEVLRALSDQPDGALGVPVVLIEDRGVAGAVMLRDLLAAAANPDGPSDAWTAGVTQLPGRGMADRLMTELIERWRAPSLVRPEPPGDAAVIDIRQLGDFNGAFGYELGDTLISELADQLRGQCAAEAGLFAAHLGDDRFLVMGPPNRVEPRLVRVISGFEGVAGSLISRRRDGAEGAGSAVPWAGAGLRVLMMPGVFGRILQPRELYSLEQQLRLKAERLEASTPPGRSLIVHDTRMEPPAVRLSA